MDKLFSLDPGGPKRLKVTYPWNLANAEVFLDGQKIASFTSKADFQRGTTCKLPDGSMLTVRFGSVEGIPGPFFKGVHLIRNGVPLPGSAADPVPGWAWIFIIACAAIPVISLGGAIPALLAVSGVSATLSLARFNRWSVALRATACAFVALACWGAFGLLILALRPAHRPPAAGWNVPFTSAMFMSSSPDKLIDDIDAALTRHGYNDSAISQINDTLRQSCDRMDRKHCVDYLRAALYETQTRNPDEAHAASPH